MAEHFLTICNPFGVQMKDVKRFINLDVARQESAIGEMVLDLPWDFDISYLARDWRIEDWRLDKIFCGSSFIIRHFSDATNENGERVIRVWAKDGVSLTKRRTIPYDNGNSYTQKQAPADNMLKAFVRENFGSLALDTNRDISLVLKVEDDKSLGHQITKYDVSDRFVLDVLQECVKDSIGYGYYLAFDVIWLNSAQWQFCTYVNQRGNDLGSTSGKAVILSEAAKNLALPSYEEDATDEVNFVYAVGQAAGNVKARATAQDNARIGISPYGRIEGVVDAANTADATALADEANTGLLAGRVKQMFSGRVIDSYGTQFGIDYDFGDIVNVDSRGRSLDCHLESVHATVDRDNLEQLDMYARSTGYVG